MLKTDIIRSFFCGYCVNISERGLELRSLRNAVAHAQGGRGAIEKFCFCLRLLRFLPKVEQVVVMMLLYPLQNVCFTKDIYS